MARLTPSLPSPPWRRVRTRRAPPLELQFRGSDGTDGTDGELLPELLLPLELHCATSLCGGGQSSVNVKEGKIPFPWLVFNEKVKGIRPSSMLDGSRNIEVSIPTGTIFGISRLVELDNLPVEERAQLNSLQSGTLMVAAGYVLYSSATILCISFGAGIHGFMLDRSTGELILTHPSIQIPPRGSSICFAAI